MRVLCVLLGCLFVINVASAGWLYDVFEEAKEGVQEGVSEAFKDGSIKKGVEEMAGKESGIEKFSNKVKDVMTMKKAVSAFKHGIEHIHRVDWDKAHLSEKLTALEEPLKISEEEEGELEMVHPANETDVEHKRHHGKHGRHHGGRHHGGHGGHGHGGRGHGGHGHGGHGHGRHGHGRHGHGGHGHHGRHGHQGAGPYQTINTMVGIHKRLREAFNKQNSTRNNPFKNTWHDLVRKIQGTLGNEKWRNVHKHVKNVLRKIKEETNSSQLARVPLHRVDWGEKRLQKLETIFSQLASKWSDTMKSALDVTPSAMTPEEGRPVSQEGLALIKVDKPTMEKTRPLVKLVAASRPEFKYNMKNVDAAEKKMSELENEWEKKVEREEEELTKDIVKESGSDEKLPEEKISYVEQVPNFPVHKGAVIPAPDEMSEDDDIDFEPMSPVKTSDIPSSKESETFSYMGIPAKIFKVGESAENVESMLKDEEKTFYKKLNEERKEWLDLKTSLLRKLARMATKKH